MPKSLNLDRTPEWTHSWNGSNVSAVVDANVQFIKKNAASSLELLGRSVIPPLTPEKKWDLAVSSKELRWSRLPKYCTSLVDTTVVSTSSSFQSLSGKIDCQNRWKPFKDIREILFCFKNTFIHFYCFRKTSQMKTYGIHWVTFFCLIGTIPRINDLLFSSFINYTNQSAHTSL